MKPRLRPRSGLSSRRVSSPAGACGAIALALLSGAVRAEEGDWLSGGVIELDAITVTATKSGEPAYGALSPSSVWTRGELQPLQPDDVTDILTLVPSVNTQTTPNDPATAVSIRGLQDFGRVNVLVDGARQNFQKSGHGANGTFYFDTEMLKAVDVTRGPTSSIYGSGAIGGVVSFSTIGPDDVLDADETAALRLKTSVETNAPTMLAHGEAAARLGPNLDVVGAATWRDAGNYKAGGGEEINSAQELLSGLAKARLWLGDAQEVTLSALHYDSDFASTLSDELSNRALSDTFTLGYRWTPDSAWADLTAKAYYTTTRLEQHDEGADGVDGESYDIGTVGFDVFNVSRFETSAISHELTYGVDMFHDHVETYDPHGSSDDLTPSGNRLVYGAFVQDRVALTEKLEVIGALRFDGYDLTGDDIRIDGTRLSPKLTIGYALFDPVTLYATYAEGYRAPSITETLIDGFHPPPVSTGQFLPNPDLKPEISRSIEGGVNVQADGFLQADDHLKVKLGAFYNRVDDYIEQTFKPFPIPGGYKYENIAEATIDGFEAEAFYDAGTLFAGLSGQLMRGVNSHSGEELTSVPPNRLVLILGFRGFAGALEAGTKITAAARKQDAASLGLVGDPYQVVDLFATWKVGGSTTIAAFLGNIFDQRYTQYPNGYPSPGFNAKLSLTTKIGG